MITGDPKGMNEIVKTIALPLIYAFILFVAAIIALSAMKLTTFENIQIIGAVWGPWVGAVVDYYFGSKPTELLIT
jgi:hypothetical protein